MELRWKTSGSDYGKKLQYRVWTMVPEERNGAAGHLVRYTQWTDVPWVSGDISDDAEAVWFLDSEAMAAAENAGLTR